MEPADQFYGDRTYRCPDPEAHYLGRGRAGQDRHPAGGRGGLGTESHPRLGVTATMTPGDFRRLALTLPGAIESAHIQGPRRAGELAQATSLTAPAISRHLRALRQAGLVE